MKKKVLLNTNSTGHEENFKKRRRQNFNHNLNSLIFPSFLSMLNINERRLEKLKMKTNALIILVLALMIVSPVAAVSIGTGITPDITTEDFEPIVWMCDNRVVYDDATEPGRISLDGEVLVERLNNYAFEGEQISWTVLVMDKNGIEKLEDVFATIGDVQGVGNDIEVNCQFSAKSGIDEACNARILEEQIVDWNPEMMRYFDCTFTVETPESMYGEYWLTVEAVDLDGLSGVMAENEYWFLNPVIALSFDGDMMFEDVRPGTRAYSDTVLIGNDADDGSGVILDMFVSGTDFYDSSSSGAMCPTTNQLSLSTFRYFATNGAYSTSTDPRKDAEGYVGIAYGIGFNNPNPFYDNAEILQSSPKNGPYFLPNLLAPGAEIAMTFSLDLPEPCNGDFDTGSIYFWGEAV